ncbi:sulfotransferase [Parvibaculum sp.]|uniref:sulfotransferase n=1 Tax=Parvibaculum sp. TaxID=2024848 RepID=UPI003BA87399
MSNPAPLVHIGYYKTGTTWLQRQVFGRRDRGFWPLAPQSITDPRAAAKFFGERFWLNGSGFLRSAFDREAGDVAEELRDLVEQVPATSVPVISQERLAGYFLSGPDALAIRDRIKARMPHARILITIRRQQDLILSTYFQYLRRGGHGSVRAFLQLSDRSRLPGFSPEYFKYDLLVDAYRQAFEPENVFVLPFEFFARSPELFVKRVCQLCGIEPSPEIDYAARENEGLNRWLEYYGRHLNPLLFSTSLNGYSALKVPFGQDRIERVKRQAGRWVPPQWEAPLTASIRGEIESLCPEAGFAESNARLAGMTGLDLGEYGYALPEGASHVAG